MFLDSFHGPNICNQIETYVPAWENKRRVPLTALSLTATVGLCNRYNMFQFGDKCLDFGVSPRT